uniref:Cysteine-rich VLP n=1 Tax=Halalkalibacterium halodurans TaxID=86665 RepID=A0A0M0KI23_ALKHA
MTLEKEIRKLARLHCANFNAATETDCLYYDGPCRYFNEKGRCSYLETAVLPAEEALQTRYWNAITGNAQPVYCASCGDPYERRSNAQKYCRKCAPRVRLEQASKRNKKYRERQRREGGAG